MKLQKIEINDFGGSPICEHNYPCPIYSDKSAVRIVGCGYFQPSWEAQKDGYKIVKADNFFRKAILKWFFADEFKIGTRFL